MSEIETKPPDDTRFLQVAAAEGRVLKSTWGGWEIDKDGNLGFVKKQYWINREKLNQNWISHMNRKKWCIMNDFIPAYVEACRRAGVTQVIITEWYPATEKMK